MGTEADGAVDNAAVRGIADTGAAMEAAGGSGAGDAVPATPTEVRMGGC